jgi:hypothetical protein
VADTQFKIFIVPPFHLQIPKCYLVKRQFYFFFYMTMKRSLWDRATEFVSGQTAYKVSGYMGLPDMKQSEWRKLQY